MNPILQVGKPRHREVITFAQEHIARERQDFGVHVLSCCAVLGVVVGAAFRPWVQKIFKHPVSVLPTPLITVA